MILTTIEGRRISVYFRQIRRAYPSATKEGMIVVEMYGVAGSSTVLSHQIVEPNEELSEWMRTVKANG